MQSVISPVDHESRHNSHRADDEIQEREVAEDTPLLHRFPALDTTHRNPVTTVVVTFLLIILLSGVIIGIYLLVLQSRAENVLPPVESPLQLVSRAQWELGAPPPPSSSDRVASQVIVVHTGSGQCHTTVTCSELLRDMRNQTLEGQPLPYNFLISSNGQTYEALGWHRPSPLFPRHADSALVLAFIGNYTKTPPSAAQLEEANDLFAESVSRRYLSPSYIIFGKNTKESPKYLFNSMETLPQWRKDLSDTGSK